MRFTMAKKKAEIKKICEERLQEYVKRRGVGIWDYRLLDTEPVPDLLAGTAAL